MINFYICITFRARKIREKVILRLLSIIYIFHWVIRAPNQLSSTVPTVQRPWPLYFLRAELRDVAEYFVCFPVPCRVFFGVVMVSSLPRTPTFVRTAIINLLFVFQCVYQKDLVYLSDKIQLISLPLYQSIHVPRGLRTCIRRECRYYNGQTLDHSGLLVPNTNSWITPDFKTCFFCI